MPTAPFMFTINWSQFDNWISRLSLIGRIRLKAGLYFLFRQARADLLSGIRNRFFSGRPGLISRSGELSASFRVEVKQTRDGVRAVVRTNSDYAATHIYGAVISARFRRALTIPLNESVRYAYPYPLNRASFRVARTNTGAYLVHRQTGEVTHILKRSVYVPKRLPVGTYLVSFVKQVLRPRIVQYLRSLVKGR